MNGAQSLFKALTEAGLDTGFANPGTSEMQLIYETGMSDTVRAVLCRQENVVIGAATVQDLQAIIDLVLQQRPVS